MDKPNKNNKRFDKSKSNETRKNYSKPKGDAKPALQKRSQKPVKPKAEAKPAKKTSDEIRLNKYIANSGVCSRRDADIYISSGNVKVNGQVVVEMGYQVKPGDVVNFDGVQITPERKEYVLLNKPKNFSTSGDDEKGSANVLDLVRGSGVPNLKPIGRMDKSTTGLLLFTNDNDMVVKFGKPNQKSFKIYQVSLDKNLKFEDLEKIAGGVQLDEHRLYIDEITYVEGEPKTEIGLKLRTSNVKVVRAIFEKFNYNVLRIDRVFFAGLTKKNLPRGNWRLLTEQEVINLKNG
ncbi:pseudouridine synthase [Flavobacterium sp.]|uniref:pseudouridine synthase n=1 Tax=Flavobacterium sp. TaxID=239 RepID=UPI0011FD548D|nr:pseudouridine synthase [Flavobacterium sp.]RZJ71572.1 MAG: rRNA pseudouridine synthase [Flavobacterium sp.]